MSKKFLLYFFLFLLIFSFVFRDLILNISTNLLDWLDYPFIIWVISQSANHVSNLDFTSFFETNAFYPHKLTLLFTDILLPQALLYLPIFKLTNNRILSFNLVFIITFILNYISLYLFWKQIFKIDTLAFLGSIFFIFSPFFHMELSHFQMMSYWPFFLTFYFIFKGAETSNFRQFLIAGLFLTVQFLASVYLAVYLIFSILVYYFFKFVFSPSKTILYGLFVIFAAFLLTGSIFIKNYFDVKHVYQVKRDITEYINYSANLSDYIFTTQINSFIHKSPAMQIWNKTDKNTGSHGSFPGFVIFILGVIGLIQASKNKQFFKIGLKLTSEQAFFITTAFFGFLFSLGPRIKFNGNYDHIPLPYNIFLKLFPIAEATRVPSRWDFLFFFGACYFALVGISRLNNKFKHLPTLSIAVFLIFLLEYIPLNITTHAENFITDREIKLKEVCSIKPKVLLSIPVTHLDSAPNIIAGLNYITKMELSSTYHNCLMVNGYSGYDLPEIFELSGKLNADIEKNDVNSFKSRISSLGVDIVIFNPQHFIDELRDPGARFIEKLENEAGVTEIGNNMFLFNHQPLKIQENSF